MSSVRPTKNRSLKNDEEMRQRIIDASIRIMSVHGSEKLSMVDVAQTAKIARATVYNYFKSKESLVEAAEYSLEDLLWERLASEVEKETHIENKIAAMAAFLNNIWTDRKHTPWYGFLSPIDEATLLASNASSHIQRLAEFIVPLLVVAKKEKQVRSRLDVNAASSWAARLVFTFALERNIEGRADIKKLFKSFLINGFGSTR